MQSRLRNDTGILQMIFFSNGLKFNYFWCSKVLSLGDDLLYIYKYIIKEMQLSLRSVG